MYKNLRWKLLVTFLVVFWFFGYGVYPILAQRYSLPIPGWRAAKQLKLGLDLQGGVHLVLRVQTDDALGLETETSSERLREELRTQNLTVNALTATTLTEFVVEGVPQDRDDATTKSGNGSKGSPRAQHLGAGAGSTGP